MATVDPRSASPAGPAGPAAGSPRGFLLRHVRRLGPGLTRYEVEAPLVAQRCRAGHFVMVRVREGGERIPLTIADADPAAGTIVLIVQAVGATTRLLSSLRRGDRLLDVLGPLGQPSHVEGYGDVACVGGGVGTAVLLPTSRALWNAGNTLHTILGARSKDLVILESEMAAISDSLVVTTDDGSYGSHGVVTDPLRARLSAPGRAPLRAVYAAGPLPMMRAVAETTRPFGVKTWVSLNTLMVDGTGMCGGCRVTVGGHTAFACVDGPEFDAHLVDFDELIRRAGSYVPQEREADRRLGRAAPAAAGRP